MINFNLKEELLKLKDRVKNEIDKKESLVRKNFALRERSENVKINDKLTSFLYQLMRDYVPAGVVEEMVMQSEDNVETLYTNGWLARYAEDLANRLK